MNSSTCFSVSMCSHDCVPNSVYDHVRGDQEPPEFEVILKAKRPIKKGEKIFISYVDILLPTYIRQKDLLEVIINITSKCLNCWCKNASIFVLFFQLKMKKLNFSQGKFFFRGKSFCVNARDVLTQHHLELLAMLSFAKNVNLIQKPELGPSSRPYPTSGSVTRWIKIDTLIVFLITL